MSTDPRYPIGKFAAQKSYTSSDLSGFLERIESLPARLEIAVTGLSDVQLDSPYREGGWTIRQVVHHVADSHMNAYVRVKWCMTEEKPVIKAYNEKTWATTPETSSDPYISLTFLKALHAKWVILLRSLSATDRSRQFVHPETRRSFNLDQLIAMYAWHGDHHLAHITEVKKRLQWN